MRVKYPYSTVETTNFLCPGDLCTVNDHSLLKATQEFFAEILAWLQFPKQQGSVPWCKLQGFHFQPM